MSIVRDLCVRLAISMITRHPDLPLDAHNIDDPSDARLDAYRNLKDVASRVTGTFIAESELVVRRIVNATYEFRSILITEHRYERLAVALREGRVRAPILVAPPHVITEVVGFPLHRGVLALVSRPALPSLQQILNLDPKLLVVLEDVVDPDNVGSVFRHAAGFGADAIVLTQHAGDPLYRKSVRTSMGWVLDVPYTRVGPHENTMEMLHDWGFVTLALTPDRNVASITEVVASIAPNHAIALVVGAEAPGLRRETIQASNHKARIPMTGHVDSLNVATAAAIALYEVRRLRPIIG